MLLWNPKDTPYEQAVTPLLNAIRTRQPAREDWRFMANLKVAIGDTVFLQKVGDSPRGIFGVGAVTGRPRPNPNQNGRGRWLVPVEFQHLVDPKERFIVPDENLRSLDKPIIRASGTPLEDDLAAHIWEYIARDHRDSTSELAHDIATLSRLPYSTERERLTRQRVGQDIFRRRLLDRWKGRCCLTDVDQEELLRASHIKAWAECDTDDERLDTDNGLLLAAHLDAAFDAGLVAIGHDGTVLTSPKLSSAAKALLEFAMNGRSLQLTARQHAYLQWHRENKFQPD